MYRDDSKIPYPKITLDDAVKNGGYYDINGRWNNLTILDKYPDKIFRNRVETLIVDGNRVYLNLKKNNKYRIPGGSSDCNISDIVQSKIECKEEAKIIVKNTIDTKISYTEEFKNIYNKGDRQFHWDGKINNVFVSEFSEWYNGFVEYEDRDNDMLINGKFYNIFKIYDILKDPHKEAINIYLKTKEKNKLLSKIDKDLKYTATKLSQILNGFLDNREYCTSHIIRSYPEKFYNGYKFGECECNTNVKIHNTIALLNYFQGIIDNSSLIGKMYIPDKIETSLQLVVLPPSDDTLLYESLHLDYLSESTDINRSKLKDSDFGIPELRKYPLVDKKHVISAIKFFNYVDKKYEKELANNIILKMNKYNIDYSKIGNKNKLKKYIPIEENKISINYNKKDILESMVNNISNTMHNIDNNQLIENTCIYPYFTPKELINLNVFTENCIYGDGLRDKKYYDIFKEYNDTLIPNKNWISLVREEYYNNNKLHVIQLGWNPEIDPSYDNIIKASEITKKKLNI